MINDNIYNYINEVLYMVNIDRESEKELINRLINILACKQLNYQTKLNDLLQKQRIENILLKYPGNVLRSIIELDSEEIGDLLTTFLSKDYNINEIDINKYWLVEAESKESIKKSIRYQEAKRLFERLIDKLQQYLDYIKDFNISEKQNNEYLNIVTTINQNLKNDYPIFDLSSLFCILTTSETLCESDIYNFLIAISINNIKVMTPSIKSKNVTITFSRDIKTHINTLLEKRIAIKEDEQSKIDLSNPGLVKLQKLIALIDKSETSIMEIYPDTILETLKYFWEDDKINYELEKLELPITVMRGQKQGLKLNIDADEMALVADFKNKLVIEESKQRQDYEDKIKYKQELIANDIARLKLILTKLKMSSKALVYTDDFYTIIEMLQEDNQPYEYIINVINMLNAQNLRKCCRDANILTTSHKDLVTADTLPTKEVNVEDVKKVKGLLKKYGFSYSGFPQKLFTELLSNASYKHIQEVIEFIDKTDELHFLKSYTKDLGKEPINKKIHEIKCSQICFILAYSSVEILQNFIDISKADGISLMDIFAIPKVFASKNNERLSGTYENFMINEKFIKEEYPSILHDIMAHCPVVLGTNSTLFRNNVELTETYGMSIIRDRKDALPSPLALASESFEYNMDRYIEAQDFDYIECFRSQLEANASVILRIKYLQLKGIDFKQGGFFDTKHYFSQEIEYYLGGLTMENIPVAISDPLIKWLDSLNEETDEHKGKIQYVLNGIYISRLKVLKYYSTLLINQFKNKIEALFYSVVKDSYLTKEEFDTLKSIIYKGEDQ